MKKLFYAEQNCPWPMWPRDMMTRYTGVMDPKNRCFFSVQTSMEGTYHGFEIPPCDDSKFVRMDI